MRGLVSAAFLVLSILLAIGLGTPSRGVVPRLAAVAAAALLACGLFRPAGVRDALGSFAAPLEIGIELALVLFALSLTGGATSDLYPLLLVDLVLAASFAGREAARFLTIGTVLGFAFLVVLQSPGGFLAVALAPREILSLALRSLMPVAVLVAVENLSAKTTETGETREGDRAWKGRGAGRTEARGEQPPVAPSGAAGRILSLDESPRPASSPHSRDSRAELLHDLKSPLSVIRVYADLISENGRRGELPSPEHLQSLENEIGLMESLVGVPPKRRVPAPMAPRGPAPQRVDLVRILSSLAESYRVAHRDRVRMEFIAERPEIPIVADPVALQRAFRNVLDNAVKYTAPGGQVRIRASVVSQHSFVVISDTGIGMTAEEQRHAFEYSYRGAGAKASGVEGRGLGLSLSRELLEANGGKISLLSEPGHGLEVTIMFPILKDDLS
jgi:signal transduction histidine kinase